MEPTLENLLEERKDGCGVMRVFGRTFGKSFHIEDEDYLEVCKAFGRAKEGEGKKDDPSSEFKKDRFITFVASDETVDSYGDILRVDGADLSRYKSGSGAFITSHDISDISGSAGVIVKAWKAKNVDGSPEGKAVLVTVYFPTAEEDPDADRIFKKYKARTLNAVSVGFTPIEYHIPKDEAERKALGLGKWGIEFRKWAPCELSAVTVPANPNALMKRGINAENSSYAELLQTVKELKAAFSSLQEEIRSVKKESEPEEIGLRAYLEKNPITI